MTDNPVLAAILERSRKDLLDLTARNRLLNTQRTSTRSSRLEIVRESSEDVFRRLVTEGKPMTFGAVAPRDATESDEQQFINVDDEDVSGSGDSILQTTFAPEQLQRKLLKLYHEARTAEEEQGVNILYLALGFLKWFEADNSEVERQAPLILIPVRLDRTSVSSRFKLHFTDDDIVTNLSLQARLQNDFGVRLPSIPELDEFDVGDYFQAVTTAVQDQTRWQVTPDAMVLWFFSFAKFLMYRDLEPKNWPEKHSLTERVLIRNVLKDGFDDDLPLCGEEDEIDSLIRPLDMVHVLDADSSQGVVIQEVRRGRSLVIQGPPGTGKSQTITNLITSAVNDGKTVLFVAEKKAALDVVHSRLQRVGLGDICLELHSNKANKRNVLDQLDRTLRLDPPKRVNVEQLCVELDGSRTRLNEHLRSIHSPILPCGRTPFQIIGELVRLRANGTPPPKFELPEALIWSREEFLTRLKDLKEVIDGLHVVGKPSTSPWRGVRLAAVLPTDVDRLKEKLPSIIARLSRLRKNADLLAGQLNVAQAVDANGVSMLSRLARRISMAPPMEFKCLGANCWSSQRESIDKLVNTSCELASCRKATEDVVVPDAWNTDLTSARRTIAAQGQSWFRFLRRSYREAVSLLRESLKSTPPSTLQDRLAILDALIAERVHRTYLDSENATSLGKEAFGPHWIGAESDSDAIAAIAAWESECRQSKIHRDFRQIISRITELPDLMPVLKAIGSDFKPAVDEVTQIFEAVKLDLNAAFGKSDLHAIPFMDICSRLQQWQDSPEQLSAWINFSSRATRLSSKGFAPIIDRLLGEKEQPEHARSLCEMAFYEAVLRDAWRKNPDLATFHGPSHEQTIANFRTLDLQRVEIARQEVASAHHKRIPTGQSRVGELGAVQREIVKKRRHLPIRKLLSSAGQAVQAIKPVFMMSPISVAQYLDPGSVEFDLLLIDEASQVQPVDALGAMARARQIVVVGDSKQLPPTRFFSRMTDGEEEPPTSDDVAAGDVESILGLCCAQRLPPRMLRWHYRSKHESLITISNREFYENKLYVFPSPEKASPSQGLSFHFVENGCFDRGGTATNRVEAKSVAEAVMEHARFRPGQTLGVGCFSMAQREAIEDELELLRRADPSAEEFFILNAAEPFFVKNLENIQGDERDVIFISIGYAKNDSGYMAMTFGPLSGDGGERRLNVLISRARECCKVFASIRADDIDLNRAKSQGVRVLKEFLKYAETGLIDTGNLGTGEHDSEFERQVAEALRKSGYVTRAQVGVAGFFIDLAVVDPDLPGRYLLGIECDGATYHSSRSARDRDRLRSDVLVSRGWKLHRIWSTDWFHRPDEELRKALAAIESAKAYHSERQANGNAGCESDAMAMDELSVQLHIPVERHENGEDVRETSAVALAEAYAVASFRIRGARPIHEVPVNELAEVIVRIVEIEGPIHEEEIARRVPHVWSTKRAGNRIQKAIERAMAHGKLTGQLRPSGSFYDLPQRNRTTVRNRHDVPFSTLRKPEMLPPSEIQNALLAIIKVHVGVGVNDAVTEAARLFGFKSTSQELRGIIERQIEALLADGHIRDRSGTLYLTNPASS